MTPSSAQESAPASALSSSVIVPGETKIGWIGTGVMGAAMCSNLLAAGFGLAVHSRTKSKAEALLEQGADWCDTPAEIAEQSDVIVTMLGYPADVRAIVLGDEESQDGGLSGLLSHCSGGEVLVDMTTSEPALAAEIAERAAAKGVASIDAPVSGGDVGARNGTLSIMIGGDAEAVARLKPFWEVLGSKWVLQGGPGAGQHTKMVNQILIASTMVGICEALLYAQEAGLDAEQVLESVASGAAGSWSLSNLAPRMLAGNFDPGFYIEHFVKDMSIAQAEAANLGSPTPGLSLALERYKQLLAEGHGRLGTQALVLAMAKEAELEWLVTENAPAN